MSCSVESSMVRKTKPQPIPSSLESKATPVAMVPVQKVVVDVSSGIKSIENGERINSCEITSRMKSK